MARDPPMPTAWYEEIVLCLNLQPAAGVVFQQFLFQERGCFGNQLKLRGDHVGGMVLGGCVLIAGLWRTTEQDQDCPQESQPNVEREGKRSASI